MDPTLPEAIERDALHLFTADWAIEPPRPIVPNAKYIGGVLTGPSGPLPPDLEVRSHSTGQEVTGLCFAVLQSSAAALTAPKVDDTGGVLMGLDGPLPQQLTRTSQRAC